MLYLAENPAWQTDAGELIPAEELADIDGGPVKWFPASLLDIAKDYGNVYIGALGDFVPRGYVHKSFLWDGPTPPPWRRRGLAGITRTKRSALDPMQCWYCGVYDDLYWDEATSRDVCDQCRVRQQGAYAAVTRYGPTLEALFE